MQKPKELLVRLIPLILAFGVTTVVSGQRAYDPSLGQGSYAARQRNTVMQWKNEDRFLEQVKRSAGSTDPEAADRARWILKQWRQGIPIDGKIESWIRLGGLKEEKYIEGLLDAGIFDGVTRWVKHTKNSQDRKKFRDIFTKLMRGGFIFYLQNAIDTQKVDVFCEMLDESVEDLALGRSRVCLLARMGQDLDQAGVLPKSAKNWPPELRNQARVHNLVALGKVEEALQVAEQAKSLELEQPCLILLGRWTELAQKLWADAKKAPRDSKDSFQRWAICLAIATRAQMPGLQKAAVDALTVQYDGLDDPQIDLLRWRSLVFHGFDIEAQRLFNKVNPGEAAQVFSAMDRLSEAFEAMQVDFSNPEPGIQRCLAKVTEAPETKTDDSEDALNVGFDKLMLANVKDLMTLVKLLLKAGYVERARDLFHKTANLPISEDRIGTTVRNLAMMSLGRSSRLSWVFDVTLPEGQTTINRRSLYPLKFVFRYWDSYMISALHQAVWKMQPDLPFSRRLKLVHDLLAGDVPLTAESDQQLDRLYTCLKQMYRTFDMNSQWVDPVGVSPSMADFFARLEKHDIADQLYAYFAEQGNIPASLYLAQQHLDRGDLPRALSLFRRLWKRLATVAATTETHSYLRVTSSLQAAIKAAIGQAVVLQQLGDDVAAEKQFEIVEQLLCEPSWSVQYAAAEYLIELGYKERAQKILLSGLYSSACSGQPMMLWYVYYDLVIDDESSELDTWSDFVCSHNVIPTFHDPHRYVFLSTRNFSVQALAAARRGETAAVERYLESLFHLCPIDIDAAETLLPRLRKLGYSQQADKMLDKVFAAGLEHLEKFPFDARMANNLAWLVALEDKHLDQALKLAQQACFLEPDLVSYRDTLSEVLFRKGKKEQASRIEQGCLLDAPKDWHIHQQIERFQQSDATIK